MKKLLAFCLMLFVCAAAQVHAEDSQAKEFKSAFVVIWNFKTTDRKLVDENLYTQTNELIALWQKGIVENVYLDEKAKLPGTQEQVGKIIFFIKSDTKEEASTILDELTFVKKGVADYQLVRVGGLWLKSYEDSEQAKKEGNAQKSKQFKHTFAVVWENENPDPKVFNENLGEQAQYLINLWQQGLVENVYLSRDQSAGDSSNIVFFIKGDTREEATKELDGMPFVKLGLAKYNLVPVGILWLKPYADSELGKAEAAESTEPDAKSE